MTLTKKDFKELAVIIGRATAMEKYNDTDIINGYLHSEIERLCKRSNPDFNDEIFNSVINKTSDEEYNNYLERQSMAQSIKYQSEYKKDNANKNALRNAMSKPVASLDDIK